MAAHSAGAMDVRNVIGSLLAIYGVILTAMGLFGDKSLDKTGDINDAFNVYGYIAGQVLVHVLKSCGDDLTRENVMKQAANIKALELPLLLAGVKLNTSPTDFNPIGEMQLARFDGKRWVPTGEVLSGR